MIVLNLKQQDKTDDSFGEKPSNAKEFLVLSFNNKNAIHFKILLLLQT